MDGEQAIVMVASVGAGIVGLMSTTAASLKKSLSKQLDLGDPQIAGLWWALYATMLPMLVIWGLAIDAYHVKGVMILGSILATIGLFGLTWQRSYAYALVFISFAGIGIGAVGVSSLTLLADPSQQKPAASLSFGLMFLTLGMLAGPWFVQPLINRLDFKRTICILALICLIPAAIVSLTHIPLAVKPAEDAEIFTSTTFWNIVLIVFLYPPLELTAACWTMPYLLHLRISDRKAMGLLAGFWAALLVSRLTMMVVFERYPSGSVDAPWLVFVLVLASAMVLGNLGGSAHAARASLGLLLLGLFLGPLLPMLLAMEVRHTVGVPGLAFGLLAAAAFLGTIAFYPLIDVYARKRSPQHGWRVLAIMTLIMTCLTLILALTNNQVHR
jgi:MFS family permease